MHHDRIEKVKVGEVRAQPPAVVDPSSTDDDCDSDSTYVSESEEAEPNVEPTIERRYPARNRIQRTIEGTIPWDALSWRGSDVMR